MKGKSKPPIYYIQKYKAGKNCMSQLGSWMVRELISFLELEDFLALAMTCRRFNKLAIDPYFAHSNSLSRFCLDVPTPDSLHQVEFLIKLRKECFEPVREEIEETRPFFYYNPRRRLIYSYSQDSLDVSRVEVMTMTPIHKQSVPSLPDVSCAVGFGKQFYLANAVALISLHEGEVEGLVYNPELGWGSAQIDLVPEGNVRIEVLEGGQKAILVQGSTIRLLSYSLETLHSIPFNPSGQIHVPSPLAHTFISTKEGALSVHKANRSEPVEIQIDAGWLSITKIQACTFKNKKFILYLSGKTLYKNQKCIDTNILEFTVYKHSLLTFKSNQEVAYSQFGSKKKTILPIVLGAAKLWMQAENNKLVFVYALKKVFYLHIYDFFSESSSKFVMPINGYTHIYHRENHLLVVHGYVRARDNSGCTVPKILIYSLVECRITPGRTSELTYASPESALIGSSPFYSWSQNFLKNVDGSQGNAYWEPTRAQPLVWRTVMVERRPLNLLVSSLNWCELSQKVPIRSSQPCKAKISVHINSSEEDEGIGQLRVVVWQGKSKISSYETLEVKCSQRASWGRLTIPFNLPGGSFLVEVILRGRGVGSTSASFGCCFKEPDLRVKFS
jgi:hypothetical protein